MWKTKDMKEQFVAMRDTFEKLSAEIGNAIHSELGMFMNDPLHIPGQIEWWIKNKDHTRKAVIHLYYDGTILLFLLHNEDGGFAEINDSFAKPFSMLNDDGLALAIQKLKEFLS